MYLGLVYRCSAAHALVNYLCLSVVLFTTTMPQCAAFSCNHLGDRKQHGTSGNLARLKQCVHIVGRSGFATPRFRLTMLGTFDCRLLRCRRVRSVLGARVEETGTTADRQGAKCPVPTLCSHWSRVCISAQAADRWCWWHPTFITNKLIWRISSSYTFLMNIINFLLSHDFSI